MNVPDTFNGMFWGYLVIWTLLTIYILSLGIRLRKLEERKQLSEREE